MKKTLCLSKCSISKEIDMRVNKELDMLVDVLLTKRVNVLIGSGCSAPAIPLWKDVSGKTENEKFDNLIKSIKEVSTQLINGKSNEKINSIYSSYKGFFNTLIKILNKSNSRQIPKSAYIFTTNYDFFIEKSIDELFTTNNFIFNDGACGYFNRYLDSSNYNKTVAYRGSNENYINELVSINLIKPHGSVNWEKEKEKVKIVNYVCENPLTVLPTGYESQDTFTNNHFYEMLRVFETELEKAQSVLLVIGFSFNDKHIAKMLLRSLKNPELLVYIFCYDNDDKDKIKKNLNIDYDPFNLKFIIPKSLDSDYKHLTLDKITEVLEDGLYGK